ncbi:type I restriction endonuclease subunit R [Candidatus Saccharibacteria bacterium]|nr:type I restriction endonuclease subunit R [Candidatus Saccharibacteria bacterium]MBI3337829.1 type I restriction endonuclease subunit R [Candidatus Saccharibacteria bacterium]
MLENVNFDEARQSQLTFVEMLINMGYAYLPTAELMRQRSGDTSYYLLKEVAAESLMRINDYEHHGQTYKFTEKDVAETIDELESLQHEGLIDTSKAVYNTIMPLKGGKTIRVFHDGKYESKSFRFIDFEHPENNQFHVAVEVEISAKSGTRRPDIVCYINGIPFVVIENKKSSTNVSDAINQMIRNQGPDYSPKFFIYPQLLIATNGKDLRYGTTGTPAEFYVNWREKDHSAEEVDEKVRNLISTKIDDEQYTQLLQDLNGNTHGHTQRLDRKPTEQDRSIIALLDKKRLLDITKNYILYDGVQKKVMRYQQFFAINRALKRIEEKEPTSHGERRKGGIIWHTQGSGKSLTMVMFVRALIEDPRIINPRILIVTDRKDLDRQILGTFQNAGLKKKVKQARSGEHLLELIKSKDTSVVTTLIHKFQSASRRRADFIDNDQNIFVLIDEAHRSQQGDANIEMNRTIPNACYIAFTGTPLLKREQSQNKFGSFIDKYTIDDALEDNIVLPLIYEGRYVDLHQDKKEIDRQADRVMEDMPEYIRKKLQESVQKSIIQDSPKRINEIAYDIEKHYISRFQGYGLKAQIVAPSKFSAMLFQKYFNDSGKINTALVISDENGIIDDKDEHKKEVEGYLKDIKDKYQSLLSYEKEVIDSFKYNDEGVEILIVVDKLLTGFDAPRNTVLYLAKELRDHNLLQAIARVNRLYDNPALPKTAGFIIDYSENAQNIHTAMQLFGNYDETDVKGALIDVNEKIQDLETSYGALHDIFNGIQSDDEAYLQHLNDDPTRKEFYAALNKFVQEFSECMVLQDFAHEFEDLDIYRLELKKFMELRKTATLMHEERVDFSKYKNALVKIMDDNIKADEAELLTEEINITDKELFDKAIEEIGSDKSKAEAIAAQTKRTITEKFNTDPEFYGKFSKKISEILDAMRAKKLADIEALKQLKLITDEVLNKKDDTLPSVVAETPGVDILYRNLRAHLDLEEITYIKTVLDIYQVLSKNARVDWWKNHEMKRIMRSSIDDYLYDEVKVKLGVNLTVDQIDSIVDDVMKLAENNYEIFVK